MTFEDWLSVGAILLCLMLSFFFAGNHPEKRRLAGAVGPDERDVLRAAAYCLDSDSPGARIEINEAAAVEARRKDIKQRFTQTIARGTGLHAARGG